MSACVCACVCVSVSVSVSLSFCVCVCARACMVYMCMCAHTYTHIDMYMHILSRVVCVRARAHALKCVGFADPDRRCRSTDPRTHSRSPSSQILTGPGTEGTKTDEKDWFVWEGVGCTYVGFRVCVYVCVCVCVHVCVP